MNIKEFLLGNEDELRAKMIEVIKKDMVSINEQARRIGINAIALTGFIRGRRSEFTTALKIDKYIKEYYGTEPKTVS